MSRDGEVFCIIVEALARLTTDLRAATGVETPLMEISLSPPMFDLLVYDMAKNEKFDNVFSPSAVHSVKIRNIAIRPLYRNRSDV